MAFLLFDNKSCDLGAIILDLAFGEFFPCAEEMATSNISTLLISEIRLSIGVIVSKSIQQERIQKKLSQQ
jgi:hypothetical protein